MGTNYYAQGKVECWQCGHKHTCREAIHLGKSSAGWKFTFAWNEGQYYKSLPEMREWVKSKTIWNEYGEQISVEDFWEMVENKANAEMDHINPPYNAEHGVVIDDVYFMEGEFS